VLGAARRSGLAGVQPSAPGGVFVTPARRRPAGACHDGLGQGLKSAAEMPMSV